MGVLLQKGALRSTDGPQRAQSREIRTGGRIARERTNIHHFQRVTDSGLGEFPPTDWKIRRFWPKMPNSSKTCGPRSGPGGSLSARISIGLRKKTSAVLYGAALVNLTDAARPEFVPCRRTARSSARSDDEQLNVACCLPNVPVHSGRRGTYASGWAREMLASLLGRAAR